MADASPSLPQAEELDLQPPLDSEASVKPNPIECTQTQNQSEQVSHPQSPQTLTLETPDQSVLDRAQNTVQQDLLVLDQEEEDPLDGNHEPQSGASTVSAPTLVSPISDAADGDPTPLVSQAVQPRRPNKRKKSASRKKLEAIEKKVRILMKNLNPIPFLPSETKSLDFDKHERLLKRLGLWEFVHIEFDRSIRVDLLAQLIACYDQKMRASYVNEVRIMVNRADLGRALKLPVKKEKGNATASSGEAVDLDLETLSEESIAFVEDFVSNWVLLHGDTWMMPAEVLSWTRAIKDGHPEKVDWAGLIWFMVDKELVQGHQLQDCYYASHLQCLMKSQRVELLMEELKVEPEVEVEAKGEEDSGEVKMGEADEFRGQESHDNVVEGPNVELTLGQEIIEKEEVKDGDMMDVEENKEEEQRQWLLEGNNDMGDHFLQRCNMEEATDTDGADEERMQGEEEEEEDGEEEEADGDEYELTTDHTMVSEGLTGNSIRGMDTNQVAFSYPSQLCDQSGLVNFGSISKREMSHEHDIAHDSLNGSNKRLRTDGTWDHKPSDFEMCMEQMQHWMEKARMMYDTKEQACEASSMNQQLLLSEVQQRDRMFELLQKAKYDELQKKDEEIFRLERELYMMGNLLEGYRKALKETHREFSEYRQRCPFPEEPLYKDAGPGGLVLSTMELEKQRLKQEEEDRLTRLMIEERIKEFEGDFISKFEAHLNEVQNLNKQLMDFENEVKLLKELSAKRKVSGTPECASHE
ncbi:uncharacterized protein LOC127792450 [Diospyros lotus]|uniref:uncharacterized protein LOC127792450 n=1 Tax=Diospyros lotus TaxID=55363 RepID=UPI0022554504|nr:uncharacterized protein LOC127792450 [Diospyros lotus]